MIIYVHLEQYTYFIFFLRNTICIPLSLAAQASACTKGGVIGDFSL